MFRKFLSNYKKSISLFGVLLLGFNSSAVSLVPASKVRTINMNSIYKAIPAYVKGQQRLQQMARDLENDMKNSLEEYRKITEKVQKEGANMSQSTREKYLKQIQQLEQNVTKKQMEGRRNLEAKQMEFKSKIMTIIYPTVTSYAKSLGVDILFGLEGATKSDFPFTRCLYVHSNCNVTNSFISHMKKTKAIR